MEIVSVRSLSNSDRWHLNVGQLDDEEDILDESVVEEQILDAVLRTFEALSIEFDRKVEPWEKVCVEATQELASQLPGTVEKEFMWYDGNEQEDSHMFLLISYRGGKLLVDPTYQQYLPLDERVYSPIALICPVTDEEDLSDYLCRYNIDEQFHKVWITPIFN